MLGAQYQPILLSALAAQPTPLAPRCINTPPSKSFGWSALASSCQMPSSPNLPTTPLFKDVTRDESPPIAVQFFSSPVPSRISNDSPFAGRHQDERLTRRLAPPNPFQRSSDERRARQRNRFLDKVDAQRMEMRWDARGDQILQHDYLLQSRARQEKQAQEAPPLDPNSPFDEEVVAHSSTQALTSTQEQPCRMDNNMILDRNQPSVTIVRAGDENENDEEQAAELDEWLAADYADFESLIEGHETQAYNVEEVSAPSMVGLNVEAFKSQHNTSDQPPRPTTSYPTGSMFQIYVSEDEEIEELLLSLADEADSMDLSSG